MIFQFDLPYPSPVLSPNSRVHWHRKWSAQQQQRYYAGAKLREVDNETYKRRAPWTTVTVAYEVHPPDKRKRDKDNAYSSLKYASDGIAQALCVDDNIFEYKYRWGAPERGGRVAVTVEAK